MNQDFKVSPWIAPFVVEFTLAVIMTLQGKKFRLPQREIIHSDMVPKFTHHVIRASMKERSIPPRRPIMNFEVPDLPPKNLEVPDLPPKQQRQIERFNQQQTIGNVEHPELAWKKIQPLLNDPSITSIECNGPGRSLVIVRMVKKQPTRIILADNEIRFILGRFAQESHVPLLEGVFRSAINNYKINAVVSEIIGSKFVISKRTPYSMLEGQT